MRRLLTLVHSGTRSTDGSVTLTPTTAATIEAALQVLQSRLEHARTGTAVVRRFFESGLPQAPEPAPKRTRQDDTSGDSGDDADIDSSAEDTGAAVPAGAPSPTTTDRQDLFAVRSNTRRRPRHSWRSRETQRTPPPSRSSGSGRHNVTRRT